MIKRSFDLSFGYAVEFSYASDPEPGLSVAWKPDVPRIQQPRARRRSGSPTTRQGGSSLRRPPKKSAGGVMIVDLDGELETIKGPTRH